MSLVAQLVLIAGLLLAGLFIVVWRRLELAHRASSDPTQQQPPTMGGMILGFVANFFDTLGIGSFASTTAWIKFGP
jgi:hypothetical protein